MFNVALVSYLDTNFIEVCSQGSWQNNIIGLGKGLVQDRGQAITWTKKIIHFTDADCVLQGRYLYFLKPTLGPPKKFQYQTIAEDVVITRLWIGHVKATKSHIFSSDLWRLATIVDRHWQLTTCSWSVQFNWKLGINTMNYTILYTVYKQLQAARDPCSCG